MSTSSVLSLPIPLILLVHLHILEYPQANKPEYDHNIFEPRVRGLRERMKLLEDVTYFLVGRLEGNARTILSTYPCVAPSDTVGFRTSLSKYLETLRHNAIYSAPKPVIGANGKSKGKEITKGLDHAAWWWKDTVVRKSLLEECAGERFERLLLSVSTHALLKGTSPSLRAISDNSSVLLRSQPAFYADRLTRCKSARHTWAQSASTLLQREADIRLLREHLRSHGGEVTSKYSTLSTERLVALMEAKYQYLLQRWWSAPSGQAALDLLTKASGLEANTSTGEIDYSSRQSNMESKSNYPVVAAQPLPIAAAHHPANLKKIRKPVFSTPKSQRSIQTAAPEATKNTTNRHPATLALLDRCESESQMHQALNEALARTRSVGNDLLARAKTLEAKRQAIPTKGKSAFALDLWQPDHDVPVKFDTQPTLELLAAFSLDMAEPVGGLEARMDEIRETLLPTYPPVPDLSAPRAPPSESTQQPAKTGSSKIPRAGFTRAPRPATPEPPSSQLLTSTPPATVKKAVSGPTGKVADQARTKLVTQRSSKASRKSIRFSLAIHRRPSLFATGNSSDEEDPLESDVNRIIHGTQDDSTDEENLPPMTPKAKPKPVNRIFTGTKGGSTIKRPKHSYPMVFQEPPVPLPSLVSASSSFDDLLADTDSDDDTASYTNEAPSMTLREILLSADTTQFVLLENEQEDVGGDSFDWE